MKNILLLSILGLAVTFSACKKNDDDVVPGSSYKVNYKNQPLQGKINGEAWTYVLGEVNSYQWTAPDYSHSFNITDTTDSDTCYAYSNKRSKIIFGFEDQNQWLTKVNHKLKFDFTADSKTVTMVYYENGGPVNNIAAEGAYEILSVDTATRLVTGRMDIKIDNNNYANGNFTLKYCSW
jgi:hypothetical protein